MECFIPEVNTKSEFLEIANDFSHPLELFREAISNSIDASATIIRVDIYISKVTGIEELVIEISDNGEGISEFELKNFFGLGFSTRLFYDDRGNKVSGSIGEKGHGTKIYFNSRRIELVSIKDGIEITAYMDKPIQKLRSANEDMPKVEFSTINTNEPSGTKIKIFGYNSNSQSGFSHNEIKDYIYWYTKFGSCEIKLDIKKHKDLMLFLRGLGNDNFEPLGFGHQFPEENYNINDLKKIDKVSPLEYYVAKWVFKKIPVHEFSNTFIDIVFYLEGDKAKRLYNKMLHERFAPWVGGVYNVEQRYGLWLCKDYIPIEKHNEWVSEKSEWTKFHAFVNCQDINLTANRGDAGNTSSKVLEKISETVRTIFQNEIENSEKYIKYQEEFAKIRQYNNSKKEEQDYNRRKKLALQKKAAKYMEILMFEPRQEGGVFSIVTQLLTLDSNVFNFKVIDYDTSIGYDLLVTKNTALDLNNATMYFVEMKYILKTDFNHSFKKLAAVICWDTDLTDEYELEDICGEKRKMVITPKSMNSGGYTKFMLVSNTEDHNIEVFVLKKYLKEKLEIDFVARGELD